MAQFNVQDIYTELLTCPVCSQVAPDVHYFICLNGHSICGNCQPRLSNVCPECRGPYSNPPTRNLMAEQMIEGDLSRTLPCANYPQGCQYMGPKEARLHHQKNCDSYVASCPWPRCREALLANEVEIHVALSHGYNCRTLSGSDPLNFLTYFKSPTGTSINWNLLVFQHNNWYFYLRRHFTGGKLYLQVLVNASKEVAHRHKALFSFPQKLTSQNICYVTNVYSLCEKSEHVLDNPEVYAHPQEDINEIWMEDYGECYKELGYTHVLEGKIQII